MNDVILAFGQSIGAAFFVGIMVQIGKVSIPAEYKTGKWFNTVLNLATIIFSVIVVYALQLIGWVESGLVFTFIVGIIVSGLTILGYEMVKNVWDNVGGNLGSSGGG